MDMPLGLKKCRGRPLKAVKGALNKQPEVNQKYDVKSTGAKEEGVSDDLEMYQLSDKTADRGKLPPSSSSTREKILKWC